jgi:hypothetical protein
VLEGKSQVVYGRVVTLLMAAQVKGCEAVVADGEFFRGCGVGKLLVQMFALLEDRYSFSTYWDVMLVVGLPRDRSVEIHRQFCTSSSELVPLSLHILQDMKPAFNMWSSVVFPALSRPRKRSFACLFKRPREARIS